MRSAVNEGHKLLLAIPILIYLIFSECTQYLWLRFKLMMTKKSKIKSADCLGREVKVFDQIKVNVTIYNGQCFAENGGAALNEKCNAALAKMNDFQREFLLRGQETKPIKLIFIEELIEHQDGRREWKSEFQQREEKVSLPVRIWRKYLCG